MEPGRSHPLIEDYAMIGDMQTAALVSRDGAVDWLCLPRFDSDAVFAAMLGRDMHGQWRLNPTAASGPPGRSARVERSYESDTLILTTLWQTPGGSVRVTDFMPPRDDTNPVLIRLVEGVCGAVEMECVVRFRFGYGSVIPWVRRIGGLVCAVAGPDSVWLDTPVKLTGHELAHRASFVVREGDRVPFVLTWLPSMIEHPPPATDAGDALAQTRDFWAGWVARCRYQGRYRDAVVRSLITVKALTYAPTGGIVAAPTTSLPERLGGPRNWDYRFCWLRDATFSLLTLMNAGHYDEAQAWGSWLLRATAGSPDEIRIMYGIAGERRLAEREIPWLDGYENSKPVRVGNAAAGQLQLDVYGEIMDAVHHARASGLHPPKAAWDLQHALLGHLETSWRNPDAGIWEVRGEIRHFTHSKVMAWVAFDRGIKAIEAFGLKGPLERWRRVRGEIHEEVCRRAYNADLGAFVQAYESDLLDASALLALQVGFLSPDDPRIQTTIAAIEQKLMRNGFVLRYDTAASEDGLPPGEGAFLPASFWLADAYVLLGRSAEARRLFKRLIGLCNDVGLLAEEYDIGARRMLGNFPQALSHIALINTAYNISHRMKPGEQRSGHKRLAEEGTQEKEHLRHAVGSS